LPASDGNQKQVPNAIQDLPSPQHKNRMFKSWDTPYLKSNWGKPDCTIPKS